jgi:putative colanic acid biosynthesis UDP-glucose lipid carrier transferase
MGAVTKLADIMVISTMAVGAYVARHGDTALPDEYVGAIAVGVLTHIAASHALPPMRGTSASRQHPGIWQSTFHALAGLLVMGLALVALAFLLKLSDQFSRLWFGLWMVGCALILPAVRWGLLRGGLAQSPRTLVVGLEADLAAPRWNGDGMTLAAFGQLHHHLQAGPWHEIVVVSPLSACGAPDQLLSELRAAGQRVRLCLDGGLAGLPVSNPDAFCGVPTVDIFAPPLTREEALAKRSFDLVIAALLLVIALPVMAVIALLIRLLDGGPVLFHQVRVGLHGRTFNMLKFRTMTPDTSAPDHERVTRMGRHLRRWGLDELPQLFNVIAGQMSIVGPRPHAEADDARWVELIEAYAERRKVKPGITGWAQVNGFHGFSNGNDALCRRAQMDIEYMENWSLALDCRILIMTAFELPMDRHSARR